MPISQTYRGLHTAAVSLLVAASQIVSSCQNPCLPLLPTDPATVHFLAPFAGGTMRLGSTMCNTYKPSLENLLQDPPSLALPFSLRQMQRIHWKTGGPR